MNHFTDDYVHPNIMKLLEKAQELGINLCQWYDRKGKLHLFSRADEKRIYGDTPNDTQRS